MKNNIFKINLQGISIFIFIYLFIYTANSMIPLCYGDDYLYSFVWQANQQFFEPLPDSARRIESWGDCFESLWNHYFYHSGRVVNHLPLFFFLWQGKEYFNFFNAFLFVFLIMEICWLSNKGKLDFSFHPIRICWIFLALWALQLGFPGVFLWSAGACNYLWSSVLLLGFLISYMRRWYGEEYKEAYGTHDLLFGILFFFFGVITGGTNENTICCVIMVLSFMLWRKWRLGRKIRRWEVMGLVGLLIGYAFLMCAPGNFARLSEDLSHGTYSFDLLKNIYKNGVVFLVVMFFQSPLWIYLMKVMKLSREHSEKDPMNYDSMSINGWILTSFLMNFIMLVSPEFPLRSTFPSLLFLLVATVSSARWADDMGWDIWSRNMKRTFFSISIVYFIITSYFSFYEWGKFYEYDRELMEIVQQHGNETEILEVEKLEIPAWIFPASGYHAVENPLSGNAEEWNNVAYARYHGIKGIRAREKD